MSSTAIEQRIRKQLPITRWLTAYMPVSLAQWVIRVSAGWTRLPENIERKTISADGVAADWLIPADCAQDKVLLYLHGGGYIYGLTSLHLQMGAYLAQQMGVRVLMVDYRLAPKHPFPAALDDCVTVYRWLLKQGIDAHHVTVAGDSAGGNLTITSLMKLRDCGEPLPAAAACLSPVINFNDKVDEFNEIYDPVLHPRAADFMNRSYIGGNDPQNPLISPAFGDWRGLPPLLVHAGEDEILRHDAAQIESLAQEASLDVQVKIYPRMWHVWQLHLTLPQATESLDEIAAFLKSHMDRVTV